MRSKVLREWWCAGAATYERNRYWMATYSAIARRLRLRCETLGAYTVRDEGR